MNFTTLLNFAFVYLVNKYWTNQLVNYTLLQAMELKLEPSILKTLIGANPKLQFLNDCLSYLPEDRPSATILSRRLNQLSMESKEFIDVFIMKIL